MINYMWADTPICGTIADLRLGTIIEDTAGQFMGISIFNDFTATTGRQICVKTDGNVNAVRKQIREFYNSKGYSEDMVSIKTLEESLREEIQEEQNMLKLLTGFSLICILMTIMTIVGLSSYHAKTNEKDNAVRNVFGCSKGEMVKKMILDFTLPVIVSALVAIPVSYNVISRWLEGYVIRTENSPVIYLTAFAIVLTIVILSVLVQALRMMQTNPSEVLKKE
jgi:putative ABC transport system permease protein